MTGATRSCEGPSVSLTWSVSGTITSVLVTQVNSLAGTSEAVDATATARSDGWDFEYSLEGMNVIRVDVQMSDGWTYHYEADVTVCGATAIPGGGPVSGPPDDPEPVPANLVVSGAYLVCGEAGGFGFNYSTSREVTLVVYAMHLDIFQQVGDAITGQSGEFYSQFYNEGALSFEVAVYETSDTSFANPIDGYSEDLACQLEPEPEPEPEETATATATVTPFPTEDASAPDPTTPTPWPTEPPVLVPSPPVTPDDAEVPVVETPVATETPVAAVEPTPTMQTFTFVVPDPSQGNFVTPEPQITEDQSGYDKNCPFCHVILLLPAAGPGANPGSWVRINIADSGEEPRWLPMYIPHPRNGPFVVPASHEKYYRILWDAIYPFGNIMVVEQSKTPKPPGFLLEIKDEDEVDPDRTIQRLFGAWVNVKDTKINPQASSVFMATQDESVLMGLLGPDGVYQLPELAPGVYDMTIVLTDGHRIDVSFEVGDNPVESFALQQDESGTWELVPAEVSVSALPQTGTGIAQSHQDLILILSVIGVGILSVGIRRSGKHRSWRSSP